MKLLYALLAVCSTALAQPPLPTPTQTTIPKPLPLPHPPLVDPNVAILLGAVPQSCQLGEVHLLALARGHLQQTGNWTGMAYAIVPCHGFQYHGCADVVWDPTGTTVLTYKARFQEKTPDYEGKAEGRADVNKRCFDNTAVFVF